MLALGLLRALGPVLAAIVVYDSYRKKSPVGKSPYIYSKEPVGDLVLKELDQLTLMHLTESFDCTAWILNPVGPEELHRYARLRCNDHLFDYINVLMMRFVFWLAPDEYTEEARHRVRMMVPNIHCNPTE